MTLPANSTFLPILDDLLSPDFRPVLLPAQTPQTPNPKDIVAFGGGKIITNAYGNITFTNPSNTISKYSEVYSSSGGRPVGQSFLRENIHSNKENIANNCSDKSADAARKIQNWWKSKRSLSFDIQAERAKHSIQHNRTEDHIRYLESEVNRLKSALSSERKIRSLQLEAIRSLWNQMQRISTANENSIMTRSVPNGLPKELDMTQNNNENVMSMSLNAALDALPQTKRAPPTATSAAGAAATAAAATSSDHSNCACSKEVQNLREAFTQEISQLRGLIHQLTVKDTKEPAAVVIVEHHDEEATGGEVSGAGSNNNNGNNGSKLQSQVKRPLSLNLVGISNAESVAAAEGTAGQPPLEKQEETEEIAEYANQMATKLVDDAFVDDKNSTE